MKPMVPPCIESLEPRLFLSADGLTPEAPLDPQVSGGSALVDSLQLTMGTLSWAVWGVDLSGGSLVVIGDSGDPVSEEPVEEHWAPFTPTAEQMSVVYRSPDKVRVTLVFPDGGYRVTDWGTLYHQANRFWVDAMVEKWTGTSENTLTFFTHDYDLGELMENDICQFSFGAWQQTIQSHWFVASSKISMDLLPWEPSVLTAMDAEVSFIRDGANTKARVNIRLPNGNCPIDDWGTAKLEGDTFVVNLQPISFAVGPVVEWKTVTHEYDLGQVADGNYLFQITTWDQFFLQTGFSPANAMKPVFRFWSPTHSRHFYTLDEAERDKLITQYSHFWTYEGVAYYAYEGPTQPDTSPVYRFWSPILSSHFYTMSESERDSLIQNRPDAWTYEGVAFYAYSLPNQRLGMNAVHRFWSGQSHFFTADDDEADKIATEWAHAWTPEGIAWYVYGLEA